MTLTEQAEAVDTPDDLASFALALREDLLSNPSRWENVTLDAFLEALAGWCSDMPGYFRNRDEAQPAQPNWSLIARILLAAAVYD